VELVRQQRPTERLGGIPLQQLVQAHSPAPSCLAGGGRARSHAALRRMLLAGFRQCRRLLCQGLRNTPRAALLHSVAELVASLRGQ